MIILDTSILVEILEQGPKLNEISKRLEALPDAEPLACSMITHLEILLSWSLDYLSRFPFMQKFSFIDIDKIIAEQAAQLLVENLGKSRRQIPDALIAATSIIHKAPLWTLDSDFKRIPRLKLF